MLCMYRCCAVLCCAVLCCAVLSLPLPLCQTPFIPYLDMLLQYCNNFWSASARLREVSEDNSAFHGFLRVRLQH